MGVNQERFLMIIMKVLDCQLKSASPLFATKIRIGRGNVAATVAVGGLFFFAATRRCSDSQVWA